LPDGFDPYKELERIDTLRDLVQGCRVMAPEALAELNSLLHSSDDDVKLRAITIVLDRGYGKPRQHVVINDPSNSSDVPRRVVVLPDNGRTNTSIGRIIDAEAA